MRFRSLRPSTALLWTPLAKIMNLGWPPMSRKDDAIATLRSRLAESIRVDDVVFDEMTIEDVAGRGADHQKAAPAVAREQVAGGDSGAAFGAVIRIALDDVGPGVVALDESERGKEFTAFKGLDQGATRQSAAGHADGLAAEDSR